jgi:hypothetical protein
MKPLIVVLSIFFSILSFAGDECGMIKRIEAKYSSHLIVLESGTKFESDIPLFHMPFSPSSRPEEAKRSSTFSLLLAAASSHKEVCFRDGDPSGSFNGRLNDLSSIRVSVKF